ncbi:MAG: hypothetical protein NTV70_22855 [Acidobacteria bacterium]|nr:hypothetical protein [Acidobacteriota bacterium]
MTFRIPWVTGLTYLALATPALAGLYSQGQLAALSQPMSELDIVSGAGEGSLALSLNWTKPVFGPDTVGPSTWIPALDGDGNPLLDGDGQPVLVEVPNIIPGSLLYTQRFDGSAMVDAVPNLWRLSLDVTLTDYKRENYVYTWLGPNSATITTMSDIFVNFNDSVRFEGQTGKFSLDYVFAYEGYLNSTNAALFNPHFCASLYMPGTQTMGYGCKVSDEPLSPTFSIRYKDLSFGSVLYQNLSFSVGGMLAPLFPDLYPDGSAAPLGDESRLSQDLVTGRYFANFGNTIKLQKIIVTDNAGQPLSGITMESLNGYHYNLVGARMTADPAPEPASLLLVGGALLIAVGCVRRRHSG